MAETSHYMPCPACGSVVTVNGVADFHDDERRITMYPVPLDARYVERLETRLGKLRNALAYYREGGKNEAVARVALDEDDAVSIKPIEEKN